MSAVFVVVAVTAINDYQKEQQFRALNDAKEDAEVPIFGIEHINCKLRTLRSLKSAASPASCPTAYGTDRCFPQVTVVRDGNKMHISKHDLVVGDILHLCAGDLVPADGAIFHKNDTAISEKMLTGETVCPPFRVAVCEN